jgi:hypothetical protein
MQKRAVCSIFSATAASGSAPNWRDRPQRMRRDDQRDRIMLVHGLFDRGDALRPVSRK